MDPVNKRGLKVIDRDGNMRLCSALDSRFSLPVLFVKYEEPKILDDYLAADGSTWYRNSRRFQDNLNQLLRLPHHRFWATVIHQPGLHVALESYLKQAPRSYRQPAMNQDEGSERFRTLLNSIHNLVFRVFLRMSTANEGPTDYFTPDHYSELIYSRYICDVSKLMDICNVYGSNATQSMRALIRQLIETIIESNGTKFRKDLGTAFSDGFVNYFDTIKTLFEANSIAHYELSELIQLISKILDTSATLANFVAISPVAAKCANECDMTTEIASFYESVFPVLQTELVHRFNTDSHAQLISHDIKRHVVTARSFLLKAFRDILVKAIIEPMYDTSVEMNTKNLLCDQYFVIVGVALSEKCFANDYANIYPVESDINGFRENQAITGFSNVDQTRIDYLLHTEAVGVQPINPGLNSAMNGLSLGSNTNGHLILNEIRQQDVTPPPRQKLPPKTETVQPVVNDFPELNSNTSNAGGGLGEVEILSLISSVKDLFPDYGDGFIEACLGEFNFNSEQTIDALCTDEISDSLKALPRSLTRQQYQASLSVPSVISERRNIYDGDEFDIYRSKTIDVSKIHRGKRDGPDLMENKVDEDMKTRIKLMDEQQQQEEFEEEERLQREADADVLAEQDAIAKEEAKAKEIEYYKAQEERRQATLIAEEPTPSRTNAPRGRGRGGGGNQGRQGRPGGYRGPSKSGAKGGR